MTPTLQEIPITPMTDLIALAERVEATTTSDNTLDVLVEVALFDPDDIWRAARSNWAGTKVIYTDAAGGECTAWAPDWTREPARASAALRARAAL